MSIKNWTVTTQRVKNKSEGLSEYTSYLVSSKHENHKNTDVVQIFNLDYNKFLNNTIKETIEFDANNKKGGRKVESYAQSFNFILPKPHKPTHEQWKNIGKDLINVIHKELNIKSKVNDFGNACFVNLHDQSNPHLNMLVPRIYEGERLADLDRKNVLAKLKLEFNKSVLKHCEIDHTHHNPLRVNTGRRKNKQRYEYDEAKEVVDTAVKASAEAVEAKAQADLAQKQAALQIKEMDLKLQKMEIESEKLSFFLRAFNKFKSNIIKWINSVNNDESNLSINANRENMQDSANEIIDSDKVDDENAKLVESIVDQETKDLEKKNPGVVKPTISRRRTKIKNS